MSTRKQDIVLGAVSLLAFPAAIHLTDLACSEPGSPGEPTVPPAGLAATDSGR